MIRFFDAMILARTKLKSHKVRTGLTIAISGLLFSVLLTIIVVSQGVFTSVDNFSQEGLNSRAIVAISHSPKGLNAFDFVDDAEVIAEELQAGYLYDDSPVRHSLVRVTRSKSE